MELVLTGSVAFDYLMSFPGYFRDHILPDRLDSLSLSFLVDSMMIQRGGNAPNIAYTLALLGERPRLMATVGQDFEEYRHWLESKGVDTRAVKVISGVLTASFFANTDRANSQIASFYPGAMAYAHQLSAELAAAQIIGARRAVYLLRDDALATRELSQRFGKRTQVRFVRLRHPRRKSALRYADQVWRERLFVFANAGKVGHIVTHGVTRRRQHC